MLTSLEQAEAQVAANAQWWTSASAASLYVEGCQYILRNRAIESEDAASKMKMESMQKSVDQVLNQAGLLISRSNGRARRVGASLGRGRLD